MKKYRTTHYNDAKIDEVEILRETDSSVFTATTRGRKKEQREAKVSGYHQYHDTWEAAHKYLLEMAQNELKRCEQRLDYAKKILKTIEGHEARGRKNVYNWLVLSSYKWRFNL